MRPSRRLLAPVLVAVLITAVLGAGLAAAGARRGADRALVGRLAPVPQTLQSAPSQPSAPPTTAEPGPRLPHVPPTQRKALEKLMDQVAEVRGLEWREPLNLRIVGRAEMVRRLRAANARDTDPAQVAAEEATLKLLGLLPAGLDYKRLLDDLLGGVVLGFYDPETRELYVAVGDANDLNAADKATIVHEMAHALTDQHFAYGAKSIALDKADKADESMALSALLEGDARFTEYAWMDRHLTEIEALAVLFGLGVDAEAGGNVLARTPPYFQQALYFPYEAGTEFVEQLHAAGGFNAVNAAYRKLPASTEQILHPETYRAGAAAAPPPLPDVAAASGCRQVRAGSLGEFDMGAVLDHHLGDAVSANAAKGWNGDAYSLVRCGNVYGLADRWVSDRPADAARLAEALAAWAPTWSGGSGPGPDGRFSGPSGAGHIVRSGSRVDLVLAHDGATADRLARALGAPAPAAA